MDGGSCDDDDDDGDSRGVDDVVRILLNEKR